MADRAVPNPGAPADLPDLAYLTYPAYLAYAVPMALPWLLALKAIPWSTILANAPTIARSAEELLAGTRQRRAAASQDELRVLEERIAALEEGERQTAELLAQMTAQIQALTTATRVLEGRLRWLLASTALSAAIALTALVLLLFRT
jgi:hypothetical protein